MHREYWQHYQHQADIGIRAVADSLEKAFALGAQAMLAVITDIEQVKSVDTVEVQCADHDPEMLFIDWLNAILYHIDTDGMVFSRFDVKIEGDRLTAKLYGEKINPAIHDLAVQVKAATYYDLAVRQLDSGQWLAQCVVDV